MFWLRRVFSDYNPHYFRYDLLFSVLLTSALLIVVCHTFTVPPLSFQGRVLILVGFCSSFWLIVFSRSKIEQQREQPRVKKGTAVLPPLQYNKFHKGDGIGFPHTHRGKTNLLHITCKDEESHIQIVGDTGTGKSALFHYMLSQIAERKQDRVIIYDPTGEFWENHSNRERGDIWLYPFDPDSLYWDLAEEIEHPKIDPPLLSQSFILPEEGTPNIFEKGAQDVMTALLVALEKKRATVGDLLEWMSDYQQMADIVKGSPAAHFIDFEAKDQKAGMLATLATAAKGLSLVPPAGNRQRFSFARWNREKAGWIFLGARSLGEQEILEPLTRLWFDLSIRQLTKRKAKIRSWVFIDELASLKHLPVLPKTFAQVRKYGVCVVAGFQGRSQMKHFYGDIAEAMLSSAKTKLFLRASDYDSAEWAAQTIGKPELVRWNGSRSVQLSGDRPAMNMRKERGEEFIVIPNEIQTLQDRHAYLLYRGLVTPISFDYPTLHAKRAAYEEIEQVHVPLLSSHPAAVAAAQQKK